MDQIETFGFLRNLGGSAELALFLFAPGTRKGNRYWLVRGTFAGRRIELSTRTTDEIAAQVFLRGLERELAATIPPKRIAAATRLPLKIINSAATTDASAPDKPRRVFRRPALNLHVEPETRQRIVARAEESGRSITKETEFLLERALADRAAQDELFLTCVKAIESSMDGLKIKLAEIESSVAAVRRALGATNATKPRRRRRTGCDG
jgi:hypothetical protein